MSLNTTPRTWVAGEVSTAANFNAEVRDAFTGIQAAWTSYTPSWTGATTNPVIGNGTITGAYLQIGKTVLYRIGITIGSTTTMGTGVYYTFSLPMTANSTYTLHAAAGFATFFDTSAPTVYMRFAALQTGLASVILRDQAGAAVSPTVPVVPAVGDTFAITGAFEAA